jgi:uncharacterized protein YciI
MSYFTVFREAGAAWRDGGIAAQPAMDEHIAFMNALADEGLVRLAGPLAGTEAGLLRALLIINAGDEAEIRRRLTDDPWSISQQLKITRIESWNVFVGAERLATVSARA